MKKSDIQNIITTMNTNDRFCQGAPQQVANGFYRIVDMLGLLLNSLDEEKVYQSEINSIISTLNINNSYCQGAAQQSANGAYRTVELLNVLIKILDKSSIKKSSTASIIQTMNLNNSLCQGAPQQMSNGAYRIVEMLQIIAELINPDLKSSIDAIVSEMNLMNGLCQSAPQQTQNGTSTIYKMTKVITKYLDSESKYSSKMGTIDGTLTLNSSYCTGADQQSANSLYRTMELFEIIANLHIEKLELRIKQYWEEHAEEKAALLDEKARLNSEIDAINKEASQVNDGGESEPINAEIAKLSNESQSYGQPELKVIEKDLDLLKKEYLSIGFFKFKDKKAVQEKIDQKTQVLNEKKFEIKKEQNRINNIIEDKKLKIDKINQKVDAEKNTILKKSIPLEKRIAEIDYELTKSR